MKRKRWKLFTLTLEQLTAMVTGLVVVDGIPPGATIQNVVRRASGDQVVVYVEHESFEPVPYGEPFPTLPVRLIGRPS
jgi:hypothetical protein